ncbi:MAG: class I SAM-dependent methyltransferase [Planctomycetota bacterium]|nr:class I SAM-dependent methyltransferase [Planctomycetota bacterium]
MAVSRSGLYDDALVYDVLHAPGTAGEVSGLEAIEKRFVADAVRKRGRCWLEPACGTGRYLREAARRGIETIGFDLLPNMVEFARDRAPEAGRGVGSSEYFVGDMTDFADRVGGRRVSFAFNTINTIRHLSSDAAARAHFGQVAEVLAPGGVYVVGLSLSAYGRESPSEDVWSGRRGSLGVKQVVQYLPPRTDGNPKSRSELVVSHLVVERPGGTDHRDSMYRLRTYSHEEWIRLVERSALQLVGVVDEDGGDVVAGDGGYVLFVLCAKGI